MAAQNSEQEKFVLTCIDGSSITEAVCDYTSWISQKVTAPIKLLHTIEHSHNPMVSDYSGAIGLGSQEDLLNELTELEQNRSSLLIKKGQLMLNAAKDYVAKAGATEIKTCQLHGSLTQSLIELEEDIRVLVVGLRDKTHSRASEGLDAELETIIRALHKPILVVNESYTEPKNVMLAYDGSKACQKALSLLTSSPLFNDITCHIVHVGNKGQALLDEAASQLRSANLEVITAQLQGNIEEVLCQYQSENNIDLMMMGAFSHHYMRDFLLGSFTAKMLAATNKPLLLLR